MALDAIVLQIESECSAKFDPAEASGLMIGIPTTASSCAQN